MRDRSWFVRLYGEIILELKRGDYQPYRRINHALSHLYHNNNYRPLYYGVFRAIDVKVAENVKVHHTPQVFHSLKFILSTVASTIEILTVASMYGKLPELYG